MLNTNPSQGLTLIDIHKSFDEKQALVAVSFEVHRGEIMALLGPSGSGKSTLLAIIAGLLAADHGDVLWDGNSLSAVPPHRRGFGLMFQDFALFPHRNVYDNVAFGLQMSHAPASEIRARVTEMLELVDLPGFEKRDVNTLSGGEQQRVALARSLAPQPRLLMLDEPLGSLDRNLRERLVVDLRHILRRMQQTAIYVTHDQEEAFTLADRVAVMNAGRVEQIDSPQEIYRHPASVFVARFLGLNNLIPGEVRRDGEHLVVETPIGSLPLDKQTYPGDQAKRKVTVLFRPDTVQLDGQGPGRLQGTLNEASFRGSTCRAVVSINRVPLRFDFPSNVLLPPPGEKVQLSFDPAEAVQLFP